MIAAEMDTGAHLAALAGAAPGFPSIDPTFAFRESFGLQSTPARVLANLYARGPDCWSSVSDVTGWLRFGGRDAARQAIVAIRKALVSDAIEVAPERGYRLTDDAMEECRRALCRLGNGLLEAA